MEEQKSDAGRHGRKEGHTPDAEPEDPEKRSRLENEDVAEAGRQRILKRHLKTPILKMEEGGDLRRRR